VGECVIMFAYSSRPYKPISTKLGMLIPWDQQEICLKGLKKLSWVQVPMRAVAVTQKLSMMEMRPIP
jgi:hypothetical protein